MNVEHWRLTESLFHEALRQPQNDRDAWLQQACGADAELFRAVASLLANHHESPSAGPWAAAAAHLIVEPVMLEPGQYVGPYQIVSFLGAGGMGDVYRALDTTLKRQVALKVLPEAFARDADRMMRFQREAEVLASLNHPNIAQIYGIEQRALVMELVEGDSPKGPLPFDEAWRIARQVADALEYAHEHGVIHRDLKPANVKVTPDGSAKLLDFGLATAYRDTPEATTAYAFDRTATSSGGTGPGFVLGTAAYMAPEQARGKRTDKRADIWAWGVLLYELLTGEQLFTGDSPTDVISNVLTRTPHLDKLPPQVRTVLRRCLEKDPSQRLRDIGDTQFLLEGPQKVADTSRSGPRWKTVFSAAVAVSVAALGYVSYLHWQEPSPVLRLSLPLPERSAFALDYNIPAISPDGRHIVFVATLEGKNELWIRDLDSFSSHRLTGTEEPRFPFWSPDSKVIGFFADRKLKRIDAQGGPTIVICDISGDGGGGSWSKDGVIVFASGPSSGIFRVPAVGGGATEVTSLDRGAGQTSHRFPWFLPDGHHFLFTVRNVDRRQIGIFLGDVDSATSRPLIAANSNAVYSPPGDLLFLRERALMAQPFDASALRLSGDAAVIAEAVDISPRMALAGQFSVSQTGILAYSSGNAAGDAQLTWFDRTGTIKGTLGKPSDRSFWPAISPDGKTVAVERLDRDAGAYDIWTYNQTAGESRFTFGPETNLWPAWSPDASYIAFVSLRGAPPGNVYRKATIGADHDELVDRPGSPTRILDWSRNGYLLEHRSDGHTWVLQLFGDRRSFPLQTDFHEEFAQLSPDGQWLAYDSDESKRPEVYVRTFPNLARRWQVSTNGGSHPVWSRDGAELYFVSPRKKMMTVRIRSRLNFDHDAPQELFDSGFVGGPDARFDVSEDGRFLVPAETRQPAQLSIMVVVNWQEELKQRLPTR
jgi:eukaryotic-like serine/threonine-protein kinase